MKRILLLLGLLAAMYVTAFLVHGLNTPVVIAALATAYLFTVNTVWPYAFFITLIYFVFVYIPAYIRELERMDEEEALRVKLAVQRLEGEERDADYAFRIKLAQEYAEEHGVPAPPVYP